MVPPKHRDSSPTLGCHLCSGTPEGNPRVSSPHPGLPKSPPMHRHPTKSYEAHPPILRKPPLTLWTPLLTPRTTWRPQVLGGCGVLWGAGRPLTPPTLQALSPRGMWCCALPSSQWRPSRQGWARSLSMLKTPRDTLRRYRRPWYPLWEILPVSLSGRPPQCPSSVSPLSPVLGSLPTPGQGGPQQ